MSGPKNVGGTGDSSHIHRQETPKNLSKELLSAIKSAKPVAYKALDDSVINYGSAYKTSSPPPHFRHSATTDNLPPRTKAVSNAAQGPLPGAERKGMLFQAARVNGSTIGKAVQFSAPKLSLDRRMVTLGAPRGEAYETGLRTLPRGRQEMQRSTEELSEPEAKEKTKNRPLKRGSDSQGSGTKGDTGHHDKKRKP